MNKAFYFFVSLFLLCSNAHAQTVSKDKWWEDLHKWNGITPWVTYMQLSAKYMGPNGMPVPQINNALVPEHSFFEIGAAGHTSPEDRTANGFMHLQVKAGRKAALVVYFVPYEVYNMDTITSRYTRNTRDFDGKGSATGDVYIDGYYQVATEKKGIPDILLSFGVKTASGNNVEAARYTDAPGYYFSISTGRTHKFPNSFISSIHPYVLTGMYAWQTYREDYRQNDAFLFGVGINVHSRYFTIDEQLSGYMGYIKNGDQPVVTRTTLTSKFKNTVNYKLAFQQGIHDYGYTSLMVSSVIDLSKIKLKLGRKTLSPFK